MVFDGHKQERDSVEELDAIDGAHSHVEEDTKEDGKGNVLENWSQQHGQADHNGNDERREALV